LYGSETWFLTLREEHSLRVFGNRVLRSIFGPEGEKVTGEWGKLRTEELYQVMLGLSNQGGSDERAWQRWEMSTKFKSEYLKGRNHSKKAYMEVSLKES
jgi:hypothetical protein